MLQFAPIKFSGGGGVWSNQICNKKNFNRGATLQFAPIKFSRGGVKVGQVKSA